MRLWPMPRKMKQRMSDIPVHYVLWLLPPDNERERLARLIAELAEANETAAFDPHITLLDNLEGEEDLIRSRAHELALDLAPLDLRLTNADYLDEFHRALFIHVEDTAALLGARKKARLLFAVGDDREFMPHLSLLYGNLTPAVKETLLDDMGRKFDLAFRVTHLLLVAIAGPQPDDWRYLGRFRLGCDAS